MDEITATAQLDLDNIVKDVLNTIDREREREIISRRFGLFDRKETLEQIGELLGITRERVRQLEKAVVTRLKLAGKELPHIQKVEEALSGHLKETGHVARTSDLASKVSNDSPKINQSRVAFLAHLSPGLAVIEDSDNFFHSVGLTSKHSEKQIRDHVDNIVEAIKKIGGPTDIPTIAKNLGNTDHKHVEALAGISKNVASLHGRWGLIRWPMVNPKNIRDKIYVILHDNKKPMHFSEIAESIKSSDFKRKDVTTQAIHNELIKDGRFVLIGRGIYALKEWGYKKGTVADVIAEVLRKEGGPLHRDEIVRRVLKSRQVKETTILLNLQGKPQFKRVAKATYALAE
ncbi:MAG TPA: sigma factor-like helix-turn-helix DNA-binding protein [Candidatus Saccharimonadales bacterium]|nr:sigma factor-like helix-turn-helix DNA-binding protein [Candidatus Saccharimonadales bacterium]